MANAKNQHVVPHNGGWAVRGAGNVRITRQFDTQRQAYDYGRQTALNQQSELFVHNRLGRIRQRNSYGNDPHPPKG